MNLKENFILSCEFFPPHTEQGVQKLRSTREQLQVLQPAFFSVTFGAGGTTQERTVATVLDIQKSGISAAPHLSCVASTQDNVRQLLKLYQQQGVNRIVALRGDTPSGWVGRLGDFAYANELVEFIRKETGDHFFIEVAAYPEVHPQARSAKLDLDFFQQKVTTGANGAITQYFYNADAYFYFIEACSRRSIQIPIVPGIMPIYNYEQLTRFSETCGAEIPRWLRQQLRDRMDDKDALRQFGIEVVTRLCEQLIAGGAPGLHFYTLNQADTTLEITRHLGLIH